MDNIYDLTAILKLQRNASLLIETLLDDGWVVSGGKETRKVSGVICLKDHSSDVVLAFGLDKKAFSAEVAKCNVHWGHFVLAWDVLVDPELPHDDVHRAETLKMFLASFGTIESSKEFLNDVNHLQSFGLVVVVDRCKLDGPISYELVTIEKIIQVLKN